MNGPEEERGRQSGDRPAASTPAELFALLWNSLADVLGTAAAATLLRRAARRASGHTPALNGVIITHQSLTYVYQLPDTWQQSENADALAALGALVAELRPLLVELTGPVLVRHLDRLTPFRERGIRFTLEKMPP